MDETQEGVKSAVDALCAAPALEVTGEATKPQRQVLTHRWYPSRALVACGVTEAMAAGALSEDPGKVGCRDCLRHGHYAELRQAVAALQRLGVEVGDPATAQVRGLVVIIYSGAFGDGRRRLAWKLDPEALPLSAPPIRQDVALVAEAQAALDGRRFTRMEARHLVEKLALARELGQPAEEAPTPRAEEAEEAEALPPVAELPPVHYSDWGRCLNERDDDVVSTDPAKVTCAECLRLMAEDADADAEEVDEATRAAGASALAEVLAREMTTPRAPLALPSEAELAALQDAIEEHEEEAEAAADALERRRQKEAN